MAAKRTTTDASMLSASGNPVNSSSKNNTRAIKIANDNPRNSELSNPTRKWVENYFNHKTFKICPISEECLEDIAKDYIDFCENNPYAMKRNQFLRKWGIHKDTWDAWIAKYPAFAASVKYGDLILGDQRFMKVTQGVWNERMIKSTQYLYDPEQDTADIRNAELKAKQVITVSGISTPINTLREQAATY